MVTVYNWYWIYLLIDSLSKQGTVKDLNLRYSAESNHNSAFNVIHPIEFHAIDTFLHFFF